MEILTSQKIFYEVNIPLTQKMQLTNGRLLFLAAKAEMSMESLSLWPDARG